MIDAFEEAGKWWLPDDPENRIAGILKFDPINGIELELFGSFEDRSPIPTSGGEFFNYDIILGVISGKRVTLYRCKQHAESLSSPGFIKYVFSANILFFGHYFNTVEDIKFKSLSICYTNLNEWVGESGFKIERGIDSGLLKRYSLEFEYPEKIEVNLDEFQVIINHNFKAEQAPFEFDLDQKAIIEIIPNDPTPFLELRSDICYHVQNFLSLGIGIAISPLSIIGENEDCKRENPDGTAIYKPIEIYYTVRNPILAEKKVYADKMFFTLKNIADNLEESLKNWFDKSEDLKPVYDLYFGTLDNSSMYLEHSFLSLIQALESYHRRMYEGKYLPSDEYKKVREILTASIPDYVVANHRESLNSKIHFGNEFSLKTRLEKLFEIFEDIATPIIGDNVQFIKDVKNTRNYFTHYSENLERKAKKDNELFILTEKLNFIIEICFLIELGFSFDKIKEIVSNNSKYDYILEKNIKEDVEGFFNDCNDRAGANGVNNEYLIDTINMNIINKPSNDKVDLIVSLRRIDSNGDELDSKWNGSFYLSNGKWVNDSNFTQTPSRTKTREKQVI